MNKNQKINQHFIIKINGVDYVYVYIRKNACSAWKRVFVAESEHKNEESKNLSPLEFMNKFHRASTIEQVMAIEKRIVILRDPIVRVYSAFINQVVMRLDRQYDLHHEIQTACGKPIGKITFNEFINEYIFKTKINEMDGHFKPQYLSLLNIEYSQIWELSKLHQEASDLIGKEFADKYFLNKVNSTSKILKIPMIQKERTIRQLFNVLNERRVFPDVDSLIDSKCRESLLLFYEGDIKLINEHVAR